MSFSKCISSTILPTVCCTVIVTKGNYCFIWWRRRDNFLCIGYSFNEQGLLQPKLSHILINDPNISSEKSI